MITAVLWTAAGVLALVLLNGLYVASEFALIGSRRSQLELLIRSGHPGARRILALLSDLRSTDRAIATLQVGITAASLGLGMYGEHAVAALIRPGLERLGPAAWWASHGVATTAAVVVLTFVHVVLGEVVPKTIALQNPARMAVWIERPLHLTERLARPVVSGLALVSRGILALLRVESAPAASRVLSPDEIESVIHESGAGGALHQEQARLLVRLMDFEDLPVRKVMVPRNRVVGVPLQASAEEIRAIMKKTRHSRYPVYKQDLDGIAGYVHLKDFMRAEDDAADIDPGRLCRHIPTIPETAYCAAVLRQLRARRRHMAVVVDEHGGTAGIVTLDDLVEEILGEVQDEFDAEEPPVQRLGENVALVRGTCRLDEINDALGFALADAHVDTVAGLVLKGLGRMARTGDEVRVGRITFRVLGVDRLAITRLRVSWQPAPPAG